MERLCVLPPFRGQGYGTRLVEHAIKLAKTKKARRLEIGVIADHREVVEWYRFLGFRFKQQAQFHHLPFRVEFLYYDLLDDSIK